MTYTSNSTTSDLRLRRRSNTISGRGCYTRAYMYQSRKPVKAAGLRNAPPVAPSLLHTLIQCTRYTDCFYNDNYLRHFYSTKLSWRGRRWRGCLFFAGRYTLSKWPEGVQEATPSDRQTKFSDDCIRV